MQCPSCKSNALIRDNKQGEKICTQCGLIILEKEIKKEPEWHNEPGENKGRADVSTGNDLTQHDLGLGSRIGKSKNLSPAWKAKTRRLRKWHRRARATNYHDKSLRQALINLDKLCEDLHLPKSTKTEVSVLFRKTKEKEITSGRNTWHTLAALIFLVSRMRGTPRTEKEIAKTITERLGKTEKKVIKSLRNIRKVITRKLELEVPRPKPKEYLDRFASRMKLTKKTRTKAHRICSSIPRDFKGRKASFLAAAAIIYNASKLSGENIRIRDVAEELEVGVSSLSKTGKKIREISPIFEE